MNRAALMGLPLLRTMRHPRMRLGSALLVLLGAGAYQVLALPGYLHMYDFRFEFIPASRRAWAGQSPYLPLHIGAPGKIVAGFFDTPVFLFLLGPLSALSLDVSQWIWLGLELAAVAVTLLVLYRSIGRPTWTELALALSLLFLFLPLKDSLDDGQTGPFVSLFVVCALYFHLRGRDRTGGLFMGLAIGIKLFPVIALVYFAWRRAWGLLAAAAATLLVLFGATLLTGWGHYWAPFLFNVRMVSNGSAQLLNQSLNGLVLRALAPAAYGSPIAFPGWGVRVIWTLTQLGLVAFAGRTLVRMQLPPQLQEWARLGLLLLVIPILLPFAWIHHYAEALVLVPVWVRAARLGLVSPLALTAVVVVFVASATLIVPWYFGALALQGQSMLDQPRLVGGSLAVLCALGWVLAHGGLHQRTGAT